MEMRDGADLSVQRVTFSTESCIFQWIGDLSIFDVETAEITEGNARLFQSVHIKMNLIKQHAIRVCRKTELLNT